MADAARQIGDESSQGLRDVCSGRKRASAELVAKLAAVGVDVLYVLTGSRSVSLAAKEAQGSAEQWQRAVRWMAKIAKASGIWESMNDQDAVDLTSIIHRMLEKSSAQELGGGAVVSVLDEWRKRKGA